MASRAMSSSENAVGAGSAAAARAVRDIAKELRQLLQSPPEGIRLLLSGDEADCISTVHAEIDGPVGTPYEGGLFRMKLEFGFDFPNQPPKGYFLTRIFHPNIAKNGDICVNTLKRDWKPTLGLRHILLVIRCLLIEPYPESALNEEAGKLLLDEYEEYAHHARLMTSIHAMPKRAAAPASAAAEQSKPATGAGKDNGKDSARGAEAGAGAGAGSSGGGGVGAAIPLALNSSIANADGDAGASATGRALATHEGNVVAPPREKADKKKVDTRKKALKRL